MSLLAIALKNIRQRLLASSLTGVSVALGVALMVAVLVLNGVFARMFSQDSVGYDLVIGKKGGAWTLVLNTIFRVDQPIGQVPWRFYQRLKENRFVEEAIPLAVSDTTQVGGFPIVATIPQYFGVPYAYGPDGPKKFGIPKEGDHTFLRGTWDAVIGAEVARVNGWGLGSEFQLVHSGQDDHIHEEKFIVRGVLAPTGTANDRTAFVHVDGFFLLAGHNDSIDDAIQREVEFLGETEEQIREHYKADLEVIAKEEAAHAGGGHDHHHSHLPPSDLQKGVTAILVVARGNNPNSRSISAIQLSGEMNQKAVGPQAVQPVAVLSQIRTQLVGNIHLALLVLTILIIVVSGVGIFVSIYNSMSDRRREIAIMRALGAQRSTVFSVILLESLMLCVGGAVLGLALGHGLVMAASPIVEAKSGLLIDPFAFERTELWLIPAMIGMATLVGFLPGLTAYRTDVAAALAE
jgi:putative ABC transport system permease protein